MSAATKPIKATTTAPDFDGDELERVDLADSGTRGITDIEVGLPGPRELYDRWERQPWSVAQVDVGRDTAAFADLKPYARRELLAALVELEIGESCVTRTLSALADHAPTDADQLYLCTQMSDEARHVQFFRRYLLTAAAAREEDLGLSGDLGKQSAFGRVFEPLLVDYTGRIRQADGHPDAWYPALVHYHLVAEGILAAAGLRTLRALARACALPALDEGLTNVARDEARHLTYGLSAARAGVRAGNGEIIAAAYLDGVRAAARVLVNPHQRAFSPVIRAALARRSADLAGQWSVAHGRMVRQLGLIGLGRLRAESEQAWQDHLAAALAEYRDRWGAEHPVPRARRLSLLAP